MKRFTAWAVLALMALSLSACADSQEMNGQNVQPYGLFNEDNERRSNVDYDVSIGNVVWAVILCETIVAPIVIVGWYLYEPIEKIDPSIPVGAPGVGY